jgi:hypothetical protein
MTLLEIVGYLAKRSDIEAHIGHVMSQYLLHTSNPLRFRLIIATETVCAGMRSMHMVRANVPVEMVDIDQPCNFVALIRGRVKDALPVIAGTSPTRNSALTLLLDSPATIAAMSRINTWRP